MKTHVNMAKVALFNGSGNTIIAKRKFGFKCWS